VLAESVSRPRQGPLSHQTAIRIVVRHRAEDGASRATRDIAKRVPLVLWVDDVHWGDVASDSFCAPFSNHPTHPPCPDPLLPR
jgi:hypothetical protein